MNRIVSIIFISFILCITNNTYGQGTIKNEKALLDSLNKFYSTFILDGKQTHKKEISIKSRKPTKPKNNVVLSDSVIVISIVHSNGNNMSGTIIIEIDPVKGYYMFSSIYHENIDNSHHGFDSRTLGFWEIINRTSPNYVYSPKSIAKMAKQ